MIDANFDNIVVNLSTYKITIIDLDDIIVLNKNNFNHNDIHKYNLIPCNGCFAFVPEEICGNYISDINIFLGCQILRQNLYGDKENGFLHSIPKKYNELSKLIDECYYCSENKNRFDLLNKIIFKMNEIYETGKNSI